MPYIEQMRALRSLMSAMSETQKHPKTETLSDNTNFDRIDSNSLSRRLQRIGHYSGRHSSIRVISLMHVL
jgi:hypothetical protein